MFGITETSRSRFDQTQNHSRDSTQEEQRPATITVRFIGICHGALIFNMMSGTGIIVARKGPVRTWQIVLLECSCISHECTVENVRPSFMTYSKRPKVLGDVFYIDVFILAAATERQYCNGKAVNGVASVRLRRESSLAESGNCRAKVAK